MFAPSSSTLTPGCPSLQLTLHTVPVVAMAYNEAAATVISGDTKGVLEYWSSDGAAATPFGFPGERSIPQH